MATGYEIAESLAGMASRVDDLAVKASGDDCRRLLRQRDQLIELSNRAIVEVIKDLGAEYGAAIARLGAVSAQIEKAEEDLKQVGKVIGQIAEVINQVTPLLPVLG